MEVLFEKVPRSVSFYLMYLSMGVAIPFYGRAPLQQFLECWLLGSLRTFCNFFLKITLKFSVFVRYITHDSCATSVVPPFNSFDVKITINK